MLAQWRKISSETLLSPCDPCSKGMTSVQEHVDERVGSLFFCLFADIALLALLLELANMSMAVNHTSASQGASMSHGACLSVFGGSLCSALAVAVA